MINTPSEIWRPSFRLRSKTHRIWRFLFDKFYDFLRKLRNTAAKQNQPARYSLSGFSWLSHYDDLLGENFDEKLILRGALDLGESFGFKGLIGVVSRESKRSNRQDTRPSSPPHFQLSLALIEVRETFVELARWNTAEIHLSCSLFASQRLPFADEYSAFAKFWKNLIMSDKTTKRGKRLAPWGTLGRTGLN